eukprot:gene5851-7280_t
MASTISNRNVYSSSSLKQQQQTAGGSGSGSLEEQYKQANKLIFTIRNDLDTIETGSDTSVMIQARLSTNINQLSRITDQIDGMISDEPVSKREIWRIKIKQLVDESKSLRKSLDVFLQAKYKKQMEEEERAKLFGKRKPGDGTAMGNLMKENQYLKESTYAMDHLEETGNSIIYNLVGQNIKLKGVQKKVIDIAATLGLSRNVMNKIKRRQITDKVIVYTGHK